MRQPVPAGSDDPSGPGRRTLLGKACLHPNLQGYDGGSERTAGIHRPAFRRPHHLQTAPRCGDGRGSQPPGGGELMPKNSYIVGLDIGTKKVAAIIGEITEDRKVEVIGIGTAESKGLRKGVVVNLEATAAAIKKAQEEAELMAGVAIDSAFVGISGAHIKSFNSRGVIAVSGKNREITREDIRRAIDQSQAAWTPPGRATAH